ncbi:MAG TPA: alanine--tRNA ligase [bacterium]|nr:alanine--tRNA ligase [bacterium]
MKVPTTGHEIRQAYLDFFKSKDHKVVPSSSLVPENDPSLLLSNAGMNQFKPYFLGTIPFPHKVPYAASCQKCFRTGDLERVGYTARHHTFFEMLGNFSFGGYFKKEAVEWAWEFVTGILQLDKSRLWVSVYEKDDEAIELWKKAAQLPPERIVRMGEDSNFWTMGPTGPCGPCSEIYVDLQPEKGSPKDFEKEADAGRFLEIWNLVFTQFDRQADGTLKPLPKPNIDTGMGLERVASVMQKAPSNFETDLIAPLMQAIAKAGNIQFQPDGSQTYTSMKVISDHLRATTFLIADGVLPSNEGRGYVLRRILRRAVRHGKLMGFNGPFLAPLTLKVGELMGSVYPEVRDRKDHIVNVVRAEEERFFETLAAGTERLLEKIEGLKKTQATVLSGEEAFTLYDTYGFPLDITKEILREKGFGLDEAGFEKAMESQKEKARSGWKGSGDAALPPLYKEIAAKVPATQFKGYEKTKDLGQVIHLTRVKDKKHESVAQLNEGEYGFVILNQTPFYAEKGGQVGDKGVLQGFNSAEMSWADVLDTQMVSDTLVGHWCFMKRGKLEVGQKVEATVEESERRATMRNHTATHLLHAALRQVLGTHVGQAGSYVGPDRLRFDFTHFEGVKPDQLRRIETLVNQRILDNIEVTKQEMSFDEAKKKGAMAFFSEKYGERVRVVDVPGFSTELCGGTHVTRTGDIGFFKIESEASVASGVRRIEAVTGEGSMNRVYQEEETLKGIGQLLKTPVPDVAARVQALLDELKTKEKELSSLKSKLAGSLVDEVLGKKKDIKGIPVVVARTDELDAEGMRQLIDTLKSKLGSGVIVLGSGKPDQIAFIAGVTKDLTAKVKAGDIVKEVAKITGGGGGGRPDLAQAGGKDASKVDEALRQVFLILEKSIP